jgi:molybdopterin synthase catalytic subunit
MTTRHIEVETEMVESPTAMTLFMTAVPPRDVGAIVTFSGVVRNHDGGRSVNELEYETHPSAADVLQRETQELVSRHPAVLAVRLAHRTGLLQIGDCALFAQVSAAHRAEAFAACADLVDSIKSALPVWKRQIFDDGTDEWVNSP